MSVENAYLAEFRTAAVRDHVHRILQSLARMEQPYGDDVTTLLAETLEELRGMNRFWPSAERDLVLYWEEGLGWAEQALSSSPASLLMKAGATRVWLAMRDSDYPTYARQYFYQRWKAPSTRPSDVGASVLGRLRPAIRQLQCAGRVGVLAALDREGRLD